MNAHLDWLRQTLQDNQMDRNCEVRVDTVSRHGLGLLVIYTVEKGGKEFKKCSFFRDTGERPVHKLLWDMNCS